MLDQHTLAWVESINHTGFTYLTPAMLDGCRMAPIEHPRNGNRQGRVGALWEATQMTVDVAACATT